jgi:RNA polymerase sigma factor (sigma-70 family)
MPLDPRPWLYKVASNLAISRFRSRSRVAAHETPMEQDTLGKTVSFADAERSAICRETLKLALAQLPEPMRVCLLLYHEGLSGNEIATTVGIKPSYVSTLVLRAHQRFRRECEQLGVAHGLL